MPSLIRRFLKREKGVATVELALVTPIFLMLFLSMIELGHMIYYSITLEKALRSAATFAGRNEVLDAPVIAMVENIAKTGKPTGGDYLVRGWSDVDSTVTVTESVFIVNVGGTTGDINETVYNVTINVRYVPVVDALIPALEYLMRTSMYEGKIMIQLSHDQAMIGD